MMNSAKEVLNILSKHGDAYIVGGAVRDIVMGNTPDDFDIATNVPMEVTESLFPTYGIGKNKDFGIVVIKHNGFDFEVSNFRTDSAYSDGRHPDSVTIINNFEQDSCRRDFTINALGMDVNGKIVDFHGGVDDIKNKILRTVGNPDERFSEDYIRMLRCVRFSSRLGFSIEEKTEEAIRKNAHNIVRIAPERIMKEILKMAEQDGSRFADAIESMERVGLLQHIFPEIAILRDKFHSEEHHPEGKTVIDHIFSSLKHSISEDSTVNMAILFHDVGKGITHHQDAEGIHHYYGHDKAGIGIIDGIADRMKWDNDLRDSCKFSAENHMKFHTIERMKTKKVLNLMSSAHFDVLYKVSEADEKSRLHLFEADRWAFKVSYLASMASKFGGSNPMSSLKKIVNGGLIMRIKGISKPSQKIGEIQERAIDYIIKHDVDLNDVSEIEKVIKRS